MARIFRGQASTITRSLVVLPALLFSALPSAMAQLYEQPVLVVDPGMHTAPIKSVSVDATGHFIVTGSEDKTVRLWSPIDGKLLRTIRVPAGPGNLGKIYAVAMRPDGDLVAVGGQQSIYLVETLTGKMTARIAGLPSGTNSLAFSSDGRYLAAGFVGSNGLRVYDRDRQWAETFSDMDYGGDRLWGLTFASDDGRLATASFDGKVRLYDRDFKLVVPPRKATGGDRPFTIAFSPDGNILALGYDDTAVVDLFDGHSLAPLPQPN
ncbi:MAG: WD40 repeat domain-containing protein, partial [Xanthobacteraceae bacterium]